MVAMNCDPLSGPGTQDLGYTFLILSDIESKTRYISRAADRETDCARIFEQLAEVTSLKWREIKAINIGDLPDAMEHLECYRQCVYPLSLLCNLLAHRIFL